MRPSIHTCTRSPFASPGASRTIAAVRGNDEKRLQEPAQPRVAQGAAVGRDEEVGALVERGARGLRQAQQHGRGGGAGRHARWRVPGGHHQDAAPAAPVVGARDGDVDVLEVDHLAVGARLEVLRAHLARAAGHLRELPLHPLGRRQIRSRPGGRSGAIASICLASSRVPCPSIADGSVDCGPGSGVWRVSSATTSATPATSQQVRYRRRFSTYAGPRPNGGGA